MRRPHETSIEMAGPPGGRAVSLDIGPFDDQADLLRFAMLLETAPDIGHIDLIEADPENALFIVRAESAGHLAALLNRFPDYTITSTAFGNMVAAKVERDRRAAAALFVPPVLAGSAAAAAYTDAARADVEGPAWWQRAALAVALGAAAAGALFIALNGVPTWPSSTPRASGSPAAAVPASPLPRASATAPIVIPAVPSPAASPSATVLAPTATPSVVPTVAATPSATPAPAATPAPPAASRYQASFSTSLGTIRALNACVWDTPIDGSLVLDLTRSADGTVSGSAALEGVLTYAVTETPPAATCRSSEVDIQASGAASGASAVAATLSGARGLTATFDGQMQAGVVTGNLTISRDLSTTSSFGDTNETRTVTIYGLTLN